MIRLSALLSVFVRPVSALRDGKTSANIVCCAICPPCPSSRHVITCARVLLHHSKHQHLVNSYGKLFFLKGGQGGQNLKGVDFINKEAVRLLEIQGGQGRTKADSFTPVVAGPSQGSAYAVTKISGKGAVCFFESCGIPEGVN